VSYNCCRLVLYLLEEWGNHKSFNSHCEVAKELWDMIMCCLGCGGLCLDECWICWLVGKVSWVDTSMSAYGMLFYYVFCGVFGEKEMLKASEIGRNQS
jgi:hypothetical protein